MAKRAERTDSEKCELLAVVPGSGNQSGSGRKFCSTRLYGDQALRICNLGKDATYPRRYVQGNRPRKRLLPLADPEIIPEQGSRACGTSPKNVPL